MIIILIYIRVDTIEVGNIKPLFILVTIFEIVPESFLGLIIV